MGKKKQEREPLRDNFSSNDAVASDMAITIRPRRMFAVRKPFKMRLRSARLLERFQRSMVQGPAGEAET